MSPVVESLTGPGLVVTGSTVGVRVNGARPDPAPGPVSPRRRRRERPIVFEPALEPREIEDALRREHLPRFDPNDLLPALRYARVPHPLATLALLELLPVLRAVDAIAPDDAREELSGAPSGELSLSGVLAQAGFPSGFVIGPTGDVFRVAGPGSPERCPGSSFLRLSGLERTRMRQQGLRARLDKVLTRTAEAYRKSLAQFVTGRWSVSPAQLEGAEPLYRGPSLEVWLEESGERLTVCRRTGRFTLRTKTVARSFSPIEFRVSVELGPDGPRCGSSWTGPEVVHPFTGGLGDICLDGFTPSDGSWVRRVLSSVGRTESVLANPSNPSGSGGLRPLSECHGARDGGIGP